jgi:hypothetical protein
MQAFNVDVVLVIDASESMRPCIDQLRKHLRELVKPMQGRVGKVRFGLVAVSASVDGGNFVYMVNTLAGGTESVAQLYGKGTTQYQFMSADADQVIAKLDQIQVTGDENNLLALDIALDHPFGAVSDTKRVVAMFSDEPLEAGVERDAAGQHMAAIIDKLHKRRIKLFCALPYSDLAQRLSEANGSEIEAVDGRGLATVDFRALLTQMGKSISVSSLQGGLEEVYPRALFGQDAWTVGGFGWNERDDA